MTATFLEVY